MAETELSLAVRDDRDNIDALECLIELYIDKRELERAEKLLKKLLGSSHHTKSIYLLLARIYEIQNNDEALEELCRKAFEETKDGVFRNILNSLRERQELPADENLLVPSEVHLAKFLSLFRGREGIHARQWVTPRGEVGFTPVREPLTLNLVRNHILGNYTLGVYQLREDNTVCFLAFDLDVSKGELSSYLAHESARRRLNEILLSSAGKIYSKLEETGLKPYLEHSGFKGYHVWVLFKKPISARRVREFGLALLESIKPFPGEILVELFPKQAFVKSGGLGNLIKLPLGIHRRTGSRSLFVDLDGSPYEDQLSFLMDMEAVSEEAFKSAYELLQAFRISFGGTFPGEEEAVKREFILEEDKEFMIIKSRCPVIAKLYEKCKSGFLLTGPEISVITFTLGNLSNGDKVVNALLNMSGVQNKRAYLKSKLNGYPMS
ncbi:MAG: hypothetical protein J7M13_06535, partial [Synergistetes bacterium]|nr:hypothetical protein [Synergistota bacterium]